MDNPIFSIITPVYNSEKFLKETISSVLNQSFKNFEFIIINDASTDNSLEILKEFQEKEPRIKLINLASNQGVANARNKGLENAKGQYIAWIDSDDVYHPDFLKFMYQAAQIHNADMVECNSISFSQSNQLNFKPFKVKAVDKGNGKDLLIRFGLRTMQTSLWSKIFKRSIFEKFRFNQAKIYEEPYLYFEKYNELTTIIYLKEELYGYRNTPNSIMKRNDPFSINCNLELQKYLLTKTLEISGIKHTVGKRILSSLLNLWKNCLYNKLDDDIVESIESQILISYKSLYPIKISMKDKLSIHLLNYPIMKKTMIYIHYFKHNYQLQKNK